MEQLVEELFYKAEGRGFDSYEFLYSFLSHFGPWVKSDSNRKEYQKYFLGVEGTGA